MYRSWFLFPSIPGPTCDICRVLGYHSRRGLNTRMEWCCPIDLYTNMFQDFEHFFWGNTIYIESGVWVWSLTVKPHISQHRKQGNSGRIGESWHPGPGDRLVRYRGHWWDLFKAIPHIFLFCIGVSHWFVNNLYIPAMWGPIVISIIHHIIIGVINQLCYLGGGTLC